MRAIPPDRREPVSRHTQPPPGRFLEVSGTRIHFIEAGLDHAGPPLLMLHGYRDAADHWFRNPLPALADEHHVIAPDLPGFGLSGPMPEYGLLQYAAVLRAFLDALGVERINLLGHSMGAQVAIVMAARQPERINKLVLVDSAGLPRLEPTWQVPLKRLTDSSMWSLRQYSLRRRLGPRAAARREGLQILRREHVGNYLKSLTMPTLIIWGSRDRVVPLEHGALMARHIPHARLAVIRAAGHAPFYQKPDEFNRLVLTFLR